jgi:tRNA (adenine57-N1/adenine58-N1)-methyltransferase
MYETLLRPHEVGQPPAPVPIGIVRDKLQDAEVRKEERRLRQIAESRARKGDEEGGEAGASVVEQSRHKRKRTEKDEVGEGEGEEAMTYQSKRARAGDSALADADEDELHEYAETSTPYTNRKGKGKGRVAPSFSAHVSSTLTLTQPIKEVRGHTSYLTFACLLPTVLPARAPTPEPELELELEAVPEPEQMSPEPELPQQMVKDVEEPPPGYHDALNANQMIDQARARAAVQLDNGAPSG